jgi:ABC-type amino acid transport substrate-binding protein
MLKSVLPVLTPLSMFLACGAFHAAQAAQAELVMLAPLDQSMPIARFDNGELAGGIVKDVGDALAQRLGRRASYINVDVAGVQEALSSGRADAMCYVMPFWIDGDYQWSAPMFPDAEMIAAQAQAPHLRSLRDLKDKPVGTVAGYRYPRVEQVLGKRFARIDAATMDQNLGEMMKGSASYTIISESTLAYLQRNKPGLTVRPELVFSTYKAQCAFSRKSRLPMEDANRAIDAMLKDGSIDQILARYR